MKLALAQINPTVGDIDGNARRVLEYLARAKALGADLAVFPELCLFGYPPLDLLYRADLVRRNLAALEQVAAQCRGIAAAVGYVQPESDGPGKGLHNAAAVCRDGQVIARYAKQLLPTYDVFDESRYFSPGRGVEVVELGSGGTGLPAGLTICEDLWSDQEFEGRKLYGVDPVERTAAAGARLIINLSASPFEVGKQAARQKLFAEQAREHGVPIAWVNQVGGNDELIFDGASLVIDAGGQVVARAKAFEEDLLIVDLARTGDRLVTPYPDDVGSIRQGLVMGTRDYVRKCGFADVVLGLSGGIDSAVTAAVAVEALGPEHVHGVALPSRYSSTHSLEDARVLADRLGIDFRVISIEPAHAAAETLLHEHFAGTQPGVAEENVQARIRGNLLMALSNKFNWLLLTTGNKSELSVGYCTLYGDMSGGLAVLADVPKTTVYELARRINAEAGTERIPARTIDKPPSAELRSNQTDQDTLPPYELLDRILVQLVEQNRSVDDVARNGLDRAVVQRIARMVECSEYKRRQIPVGLRVTSKAFGIGRRMPIAARFG